MNENRWLRVSRAWFGLLLRLYPTDFREEMGPGIVAAYMERCRAAVRDGGAGALIALWGRALLDSLRNGPAERLRPAASWRRGGNWGRDTERATKRLLRAPLFTGTIIGTLTVGLGAFAVVFAVVHNVLLAPMPYEDPDDLYYVWRDYTAYFDLDRGWLGGPDVAELASAGGVIEDAAGLQRGLAMLSGADGGETTQISIMVTTPNLLDVLGVAPALGRGFAPDEVGPGSNRVAVLTHEIWNRMGADPAVIGTELRLGGEPYTIIGVMPPDFAFVRNASLGAPQGAEVYITFDENLAEASPGSGSYAGLIRARPGTPPEAVHEAVAAVGRMLDERDHESRGLKLYPVGLKPDLVARVRPALVVLGSAGIFLVLVLMVNLATLLLARAGQREQEFAVSRALGANPSALMRATLLEGALLGLLGGVAGTLAALWGTRVLVSLAPLDLPRREAIGVDWTTAGVVIGAGVLIGLMAAVAPAVWASRTSLAALMSNAAVRGGGGGHGRMRRGMVVTQVALSLVLLTAGGLVARSFERLLRADPGFEPENVLTVRVSIPSHVYPETEDAVAIQDRVHAELATLPGVSAVSAASALPLSASSSQTTIGIPGAPGNTGDEDQDRPLVDYLGTRAGYVEAMGMRLLAGRSFEPGRPQGQFEALMDHVLAAQFFPTGSPLGAQIPFGDTTLTVVGVVEQARLYDVHQDGRPQLYLRAESAGYQNLHFVLRSERDPGALTADVRSVVRRVDPQLALSDIRTMNEIVDDSLRQQRITAVLIAGFSLGALLLAAMGLFGVVSTTVNRRRHELAVRLALGAEHGRVLRLVIGEGARLILMGVLLGVPATWLAGQALSGVLVGVSPADPVTLAAVAVGLGTVALAACYVPARRVLRIQPARSLREE